MIPTGAANTDDAFNFIEFMSDPKILGQAWKTGRLAPRTDVVLQDPLWPQAYTTYREQLQSARARGPHPQWPSCRALCRRRSRRRSPARSRQPRR